ESLDLYRSYSIVVLSTEGKEENHYLLYSDAAYYFLPPKDLFARVTALDKVELTWSPPWVTLSSKFKADNTSGVSKATLLGYNVYRGEVSGGDYTLLVSEIDSTGYIDGEVELGKKYYYVVTALYSDPEGESEYSEEVEVTVTLGASDLWIAVSNFGTYGDPNVPEGLPSAEWPGGSGVNYLWEGRFWVGALVDGEKRVSHADYGNYEWVPAGSPRPPEKLISLGEKVMEYQTVYDDLDPIRHDTAPLGLRVIQRARVWSRLIAPQIDDVLLIEQRLINVGSDVLNDLFVGWQFDCDAGTGIDPTSPHIDDLVDYDGWDGNASGTDRLDIVENFDFNDNGKLDGYDERGIPYGLKYVGNPDVINPDFDSTRISPDGYPDEFTLIPAESGYDLISRNTSYIYDADDPSTPEDDTFEGGDVGGVIGLRLLRSPVDSVFAHQWWNWENDPGSDEEKYDYLSGVHPANMGNPIMPHPFLLGAPSFDYRFLLSTGPINNFAPGDTLDFAVAVVLGKGLEGLRVNSDNIYFAYDSLATPFTEISSESKKALPEKYFLAQNYPNPFNSSTLIKFEIPAGERVELKIFNILGEEIITIIDEFKEAGSYSVNWDGRNLMGIPVASGIYVYRLKSGEFQSFKKMVLVR
ncbi:MAG: T9SS type A sorting domain-containing protein, partial [Fidelibacterota bacterium]